MLVAGPARMAPYPSGVRPDGAVVATATLVDGGRSALAPAAAVEGAKAVWLRNGLGQAARATLVRTVIVGGVPLALLEVDGALPLPEGLATALTAPFAGSVGFMVEYAPMRQAQPAWPLLRKGFVGRASAADDAPALGNKAPPGPAADRYCFGGPRRHRGRRRGPARSHRAGDHAACRHRRSSGARRSECGPRRDGPGLRARDACGPAGDRRAGDLGQCWASNSTADDAGAQ